MYLVFANNKNKLKYWMLATISQIFYHIKYSTANKNTPTFNCKMKDKTNMLI